MEIFVTTRQGIEKKADWPSPYIVISIHDSGTAPANVKIISGLRAVLPLAFDDCDPTGPVKLTTSIPFAHEQAEHIWRFVGEHKDHIEAIVVHCEAGHSRSPAIAAAICKALGGNGLQFFRGKEPNMYVYRTMEEAHGFSEVGQNH
jgi:predicted protein tyrosine phosphatase